ncbi:MAG: PLP-dependent aminotransferase family protein [Pyramidobacter sp.]|nr:PLP-dependent aminotransferase family protein [Pyramidobacter sp.]
MEYQLSCKAKNLRHSLMDDFFAYDMPDMTYFTAGQPAADIFPLNLMEPIVSRLTREDPSLFAYPRPLGDLQLREVLADRLKKQKVAPNVKPDQIIMTNGGIGAACLLAELFLNPGDVVLTESPTFPETLECFHKEGAKLVGVPMDTEGPIIEALEEAVQKYAPRFFYVIPDFQNPTGRCASLERRKAVIELARRYGFMIIEDDPYRELYFDVLPPATYYSLAPELTVYMGSFSKTVAPGVRAGWLILPEEVMERAERMQMAISLAYPALIHRTLAELLVLPEYEAHLDELRADLKRRYKLLTGMMEAQISPEHMTWETPLGGMFLWCHLNGVKGWDFSTRARDQFRAATFPGVCFTPNYDGEEFSVRLTFARQTEAEMTEGVKRLAAAVRSFF